MTLAARSCLPLANTAARYLASFKKCGSTAVLQNSSFVSNRNQQTIARRRIMKNDIAQKLHHSGDLGISLGCMNCSERELCGGLRVSGDHYDCMAFCVCSDPRSCELACPNNLPVYIARHQEVRGFSLDNVPRTPVLAVPQLPAWVPVIYHAYKRVGAVKADTVAVPLSYLFN